MRSEPSLLTMSEALKLLQSDKAENEKFHIDVISDQLLTQFKIFLKAQMIQLGLSMTCNDEQYNGFVNKCFQPVVDCDAHLLFIDSYSMFLHPNLRSHVAGEPRSENQQNEIMQNYLGAIKALAETSNKPVLIVPIELQNDLFHLVPELVLAKGDLLWFQFMASLLQLANEVKNVTCLRPFEVTDFNQVRFAENGEFLISTLGAQLSAKLVPVLYATLKGHLPVKQNAEKKLLITDLDNTFWAGILGDDGAENLHFGETSKGKLHWFYQKFLTFLHDNGIILAVCSKNDSAVVKGAFGNLKLVCAKERFSYIQANWEIKSVNIGVICKELNLLPSSAVFVDDNQLELDEVKRNHPEIVCLRFPSQLVDLPSFLMELKSYFVRPKPMTSVTSRQESYKALSDLSQVKSSSSQEQYLEYLKSVGMVLSVEKISPAHEARAFELVNKTNQFNLTGKRYSQAEFNRFANSTWVVSLKDKFADHGIIGIVLIENNKLEQFVLSCRVFSRFVEDAVFEIIKDQCESFEFAMTEKNGPTVDFLKSRRAFDEEPMGAQLEIKSYRFSKSMNLKPFPGTVTADT